MLICTYLDDFTARRYRTCEDKELNELLQEVRSKTKADWIIEPFRWTKTRFLRKPVESVNYSLLCGTVFSEYQIINFAPNTPGAWSINTIVPRWLVMAFLHGVLTGVNHAEDLASVKKVMNEVAQEHQEP